MRILLTRMGCLATFALVLGTSQQVLGADAAAVERGHQVYEYWCATCHGAGNGLFGPGTLPGTMALRLKYQNQKPALLVDRTDLQPAYIKAVVRNGIQAMPFYRKTEVSDADLDAIVSYLTQKSK